MSPGKAASHVGVLVFPRESFLPELESLNPALVLSSVPVHLRSAVDDVRSAFSETLDRWSELTTDLCYGQLHQDWSNGRTYLLDRIERACTTREAKERFHASLRQPTLPGKFKATFGLHLDALSAAAQVAFEKLHRRADKHRKDLTTSDPVDWAVGRLIEIIRSHRRTVPEWIRTACEARQSEWLEWRAWRAPMLLQMARGTVLFDAGRVWEYLDPELSWRLVQAFADEYVERLVRVVELAARRAREAAGTINSPAPAGASASDDGPRAEQPQVQVPTERRDSPKEQNPQTSPPKHPGGRPPKRPADFEQLVARLWTDAKPVRRAQSSDRLRKVAADLDKSSYRPADCLTKAAAAELNKHNLKYGNSEQKKLKTWTAIASRGTPALRTAMAKLFSKCAAKSPN